MSKREVIALVLLACMVCIGLVIDKYGIEDVNSTSQSIRLGQQ